MLDFDRQPGRFNQQLPEARTLVEEALRIRLHRPETGSPHEFPLQARPGVTQVACIAMNALAGLLDGSQPTISPEGQGAESDRYDSPRRNLGGKTLFVTDRGHIGVSTHGARVGDVVGAIFGMPLPVMIRENEGSVQILLGLAFVTDLGSTTWVEENASNRCTFRIY